MDKFNNGQPDETGLPEGVTVADGQSLHSYIVQSGAGDGFRFYDGGLEVTEEVMLEAMKITLPVGFGLALIALKMGKRVTRQGWNGKNMYLYMVGAGRYHPTTETGHRIAARHTDYLVPYRPYIAMFTVDEDVVPWTASQSDLLMDDWVILP